TAVLLGAFAAHSLQNQLSERLMAAFKTGVQYQLAHAIAILLIAVLFIRFPTRTVALSGILMFVGISLFSGSLYILALSELGGFGVVTPIGGVLLVLSWFCLAFALARESI
nr:DUF423 domain-containing protein [Gammaproteobacteria bacterium]